MPDDILMRIFFAAFVICLVLAAASLQNPAKFAFICKVRSRMNGFLAWLAMAGICVAAVAFTAPKDEYGNVIVPEDSSRAGVSQDGAER